MRRFKSIVFGLLLLSAFCTIGCGNSDDPVFINNAIQSVISSLTISPKPVTKSVGQTQQLTATAIFNDGTNLNVSGRVTWSSSNTGVVTVDNNGLATAVAPGSAVITATGSGFSDTATFTVTGSGTAANLIAVNAAGNGLVRLTSTNPGTSTNVPVTGLVAGDVLVDVDVRPQNRFLYGLGFNSGAGTVRVYSINPDNGVANPLGAAAVSFTAADGTTARPVTGTGFGFDFNPAADRIRVITNTGQNFRLNPNNGLAVDSDTVATGNQMDGDQNGPSTTASGAAYTNNQANNGGVTTLYTLDATSDSLYIQNPPNNGNQTAALPITLGGNPLNFSAVNGLDIEPGINAGASNAPVAAGSAIAGLKVDGTTRLYSIDLSTGAATLVGFPGAELSGLAFVPGTPPPAIALDATGANLLRFNSAQPNTVTTQQIDVAALGAFESLVGIDFRPATGQLFGLAVSPTTGRGTLYLIDPQTGTLSRPGAVGAIAFVDNGGAAVPLPVAGDGYGLDFNPQADRLRVVTGNGLNFRVNPNDGTPVDGNAAAGTQMDGAINGSGVTGVTGAAYTNNFAGATSTTLYTLDPTGNRLLIQNPPNEGTQTTPVPITLAGNPLDFKEFNGFDILSGITTDPANAPATGTGLVVLTVGGVTRLYSINLATGAVQSFGTIGAGINAMRGFTVGRGSAFIVA